MRLLTAHRILVSFALGLCVVLIAWGIRHREMTGSLWVLGLGACAFPLLALYLRKLYRNPPLGDGTSRPSNGRPGGPVPPR
jgi:hypothetical protein